MATGDIKGFYKQKKKSGISKPATKTRSRKASTGGVSLGSGDPAQTPALIAHGSYDLHDEYGEDEEKLKQFDMDMKYGPCLGITRLQRWNRAQSMGLHPPPEVRSILEAKLVAGAAAAAALECLWHGRV